ncbi:unnamed protein product, partial [Sphacelaria rigidula]
SFFHNGFARFQWAGKAFFAFSALVGVLLTRWQGLFLDEGESNKSWLNGQASIRRVLTVLGALLMYIGVSDSEIGV